MLYGNKYNKKGERIMINDQINDTQLENVSGGVNVGNHNYVKINLDDIEGYEYRCRTCGYVGYERKGSSPKSCPRCQAKAGRGGKYANTGRFYMDYNTCNASVTNAYYGND